MIQTPVSKIFNINYAPFVGLILLLILPVQTTRRPFDNDKALISAEKFETNDKLQDETDALLPLFDQMPPVSVYLKDEPIMKSGSSIESGVAYTDCAGHTRPTIFVKKDFYEKANRQQLVNILKHELTHAWLCRRQLMAGHDALFRQKFAAVGGFGN